jgi:hypothetical protein
MLYPETKTEETRIEAINNVDFFIIDTPNKVKNVDHAPHLKHYATC